MKELKIIGRNIVQRRKAKSLTQEDLCGLAQIDRSYLSELENGKMNVTIKSLVSIAAVLECDLKDLILENTKS